MPSTDNNLNNPPGFIARLKQHHIYRVVVVYAIFAWILIQASNAMFPDFGLTRTDVRYVIVALLLGFPVVLVLAWMLIKPKDPAKYTSWQKLHWKLGSALALVVLVLVVISGAFMWRYTERHPFRETAVVQDISTQATSVFDPPLDTLVVLPFANLSGDRKQQYFSDGITEELTNALGQNTALRVIAWDTASAYRDLKQPAIKIGKALNVAHLLHGSVQREGDQVRVTVELVNTVTGYQQWSDQYDDTLNNIFTVQDHISQSIANALQVKFAGMQVAPSVNPQAHDLVLKGLAALDQNTTAAMQTARQAFEHAIALDPHYAEAHAGLARAWFELTQYTTLSLQAALPKARAEAQQALALDPRNVDALLALGNADQAEKHIAAAKAEYAHALALDPSNASAHGDYATVLPLKPSLAQYIEAAQLDPQNAAAQNNLDVTYLDLGDYAQALAPSLALMRLSPHSADSALGLAQNYALLHRDQEAVGAFDLAQPITPLAKQLVNAGRLSYQSVLDPKLHAPALAALEALSRRSDLDPGSLEDLLQLYLVLNQNQTVLGLLPELCEKTPVQCNDFSVNPTWLPLHGDPRFEALVKKYDTTSEH